MRSLTRHLRTNAVAYVALFFSLGGGGAGYAIAATTGTTKTLHTCAVTKTGELLLKSRCDRAEKPVSLDSGTVTIAHGATPGLGSASAYIALNDGVASGGVNATGQYEGNGQYKVSVPASVCPASKEALITATPVGGALGAGSTPASTAIATVESETPPQDVVIQVGLLQGGTYTPGGLAGADVEINC